VSRGPSVPSTIRLVLARAWDRCRARLALWLLALLIVPVVSCGAAPRTADDALTTATVAYSLACDALLVVDSATVVWLDSLDAPTQRDIEAGRRAVAALEEAHDALAVAHDALEAGRDALPAVRQAATLLRAVAAATGIPIGDALDALDAVLGGAS
jgi:hypothetical protein